ncbi:glutamine-hydrolyzing GMP synthase [Helicobacter sp. WB40]|uniref:GMP synthase [glutamine-hydrolyzing] n=1 Tax=Helicobacter ibis TaxID=2962633 RepID=A0ABT4VF28_9HELI|nr:MULTISPECIES: glutamine-hydrolyzing GMP synthase [Helicobacter]MDA3967296.1 glutamine-hydrolyzing GMP synthase [Helicobacter sp. WB40]MDA3968636.1 glutamine-hydrolyzing GMP synthase [Helicobacter ibis]
MNQVQIIVLDFGSQYTQLIARRLREHGVYTEIVPYFEDIEKIKSKQPKGIILSGGPASVYEEDSYKPDSKIFELGIPILGICYGMQYIAHHFGGKVLKADKQEFGKAHLEVLGGEKINFISFDKYKIRQNEESILLLWEDSVRASHCFLKESDIIEIKDEVKEGLSACDIFMVAEHDGRFLGFIGCIDNKIEMLFVSSKYFNCKIGKGLIKCVLNDRSDVIAVDCNTQNNDALSFYQNIGFEIFKESKTDSKGRNFPVTHLRGKADKIRENLKNIKEIIISKSQIFNNVKNNSIVWMSHADRVEEIPQGFVELAKSGNTHYCAIANLDKNIYALQFHPEVVHSECGGDILENFAINICMADTSWNMNYFAESEIQKLREVAKSGKVLCAVSGGVDSSVVATLLYRAIGENLIPVFVDTGLLRAGEREAVEAMFRENLGVPLITIDASEIFLGKLKGVTDPEVKRKIIGETFIEVFEAEAKKHNENGEIKFLAQGTLYPDVIESVSVKGPSKTIKSHHNVGGLPDWMKFELIEPLRELFKDEVRALGRELGMPESMLIRHPFPGPGLAIRIMGEVNKQDLDLLRVCDSIFIEELYKHNLYNKVWQAFCVLLNVKSVGVMGDNRTYDNTICVRAVEALDGMTATFSHLPHSFLEGVANRIINEVEGINRVVYDITSKPPGTIEWE